MVYGAGSVPYATFKLLLLKNIFLIVFCCTTPGNMECRNMLDSYQCGQYILFLFLDWFIYAELSLDNVNMFLNLFMS